ncbi:MAG: hypothetical protein RJB61_1214 [Actinomycetota bacterium]
MQVDAAGGDGRCWLVADGGSRVLRVGQDGEILLTVAVRVEAGGVKAGTSPERRSANAAACAHEAARNALRPRRPASGRPA